MVSKNVDMLCRIAAKKSRLIIGLMSGTSLDGLDIALCQISGSGLATKLKLIEFQTVPYSKSIKDKIKYIFAKKQIPFLALTELNAWIGVLHSKMILKTLDKWKIPPKQIDLIASHGQTVYHAPKSITDGASINSTFQAGDGDHLAVTTGIITVSDFRQKHIAAGGEGAPLAVYGDYLLFSKKGENRIMLNIGGIGNFTYLPANGDPTKVFVTDTGPGNTLIDQVVQHHFPERAFDRDALLASAGKIDLPFLKMLKSNRFFQLPFPKTTGPELFNLKYVWAVANRLKLARTDVRDLLATLTRFSAETISESIIKTIGKRKGFQIYVSGGGAHNPLLLGWIKDLLPGSQFHKMDELGISGDAKEAVLFALLANETLAGGKLDFGNRSKIPNVTMGKISFPE
jgi:anhydro-N-acetylmuramic acid kinase